MQFFIYQKRTFLKGFLDFRILLSCKKSIHLITLSKSFITNLEQITFAPDELSLQRMRLFFFLILVSTGMQAFTQRSAYNACVADTFDLLNNKTFKELKLEDTNGHLFNTSALYGKTIYIDFWFTSCAPCIKEIPYSASLQQFFAADTNIVFLSICIDNTERKSAWKQLIQKNKMTGIHLFYARNRPQKINLLREYEVTFPTYLLVSKDMKVIGYNAPRPSEEGWVHWAISQAENGVFLSASYRGLMHQSIKYKEFINKNLPAIVSLRK